VRRRIFELSKDDYNALVDAMLDAKPKGVGHVYVKAEEEWSRIGAAMGFDPQTVRPVLHGNQPYKFTAIPQEKQHES
jgi:hypothetical protein